MIEKKKRPTIFHIRDCQPCLKGRVANIVNLCLFQIQKKANIFFRCKFAKDKLHFPPKTKKGPKKHHPHHPHPWQLPTKNVIHTYYWGWRNLLRILFCFSFWWIPLPKSFKWRCFPGPSSEFVAISWRGTRILGKRQHFLSLSCQSLLSLPLFFFLYFHKIAS